MLLVVALVSCGAMPSVGTALELYVTDWYGDYSVVTDNGGFTSSVHLAPGIITPHGVEIGPGGNLYISGAQGVQIFQPDGTPVAPPQPGGLFAMPNTSTFGAMAIDPAGYVYHTNRFSGTVRKFAPDGTSLYGFALPEVYVGNNQGAFDLALDNEGYLQVVATNGQVHKYDTTGQHIQTIDFADRSGGVTVDSQNNLYVSGNIGGKGGDSGVWKITPGGSVSKYYNTSIDIAGIEFNRNDELYAAVASHIEKVDTSGTIIDQIVTGHAFGHYLTIEEEPIPVDTNANLSFDNQVDVNHLEFDLGTHSLGNVFAFERDMFSLFNLESAGVSAAQLTSISATGDTDTLFSDIGTFFRSLEDGHGTQFSTKFLTKSPGVFRTSYELTFTDDFGGNEILTVDLRGVVQMPENDPAVPDLVYNAHTGEVMIEPAAGDTIIGYNLSSDDAFLNANHTPALGGLSTALPGEIGEAALGSINTPASIGNILPAGLTMSDFYDTFTARTVSSSLGAPLVDFDLEYYMCAEGDADCDSDIDMSGDILPAFSNFTGPGSFGKTRAEGDVGPHLAGDGDVDMDDIMLMLANFSGPVLAEGTLGGLSPLTAAEAADPNIPDLIYDAATGEVILDPDGSGIIGYSLKSAGAFLTGDHTPVLGGVSTSLTTELAEAALSSPGSAVSIGFVLPTGLDLASLAALLTTSEVSRSLGAPLVPFDLVVLSGSPAVPEPSTYVMAALGLAGMGILAARRRRTA